MIMIMTKIWTKIIYVTDLADVGSDSDETDLDLDIFHTVHLLSPHQPRFELTIVLYISSKHVTVLQEGYLIEIATVHMCAVFWSLVNTSIAAVAVIRFANLADSYS